MRHGERLTGVETFFNENDVIVSKTNLKGIITYANRTFLTVSGFDEAEVIGQPHNLIRHPQMPRCIFKMLWEALQDGREIFAYVVNRTKQGHHYWVLAHVTPSFDADHRIVGYHSNRRVPDREPLEGIIIPLYRRLTDCEQQATGPKEGLQASGDLLRGYLEEKGVRYDQFIFSL
ncbi:PAS domain-containing protein [Magnetospirillum sp. 15-1]|uniref:PAS domain-containing protein n=1 Tax=Magnetospirillum sp. 15-1 TaxID=1979370 RepID=UPI000BBC8587|nr:PAS domain-containing protein [Magnetospirillum sp. 15-1]